jgi:hypothetical protein
VIDFLAGESPSQTVPVHTDGATSAREETLEKWAKRAPSWVSPIALDMALNQLQTMQYFPSYVPPAQFAQWEREHSRAFVNVYAFISNLSQVAALASHYYWDYLDLPDFQHVHILVPQDQEYQEAQAKLIETIAHRISESRRARAVAQEIRTAVARKIRTKCDVAQVRSVLRYDLKTGRLHPGSDDALQLDNAWLYELSRHKVFIGFADNYASDQSPVEEFVSVMLTTGEVDTLVSQIVTQWDSI